MIISKSAEYALRIVAYLALQDDLQQLQRGQDISEETNIPPQYALKILRRLVDQGVLDGVKGHGGGFRLKPSRRNANIMDVLDAIGEPSELKRCVFGLSKCSDRNPCPLHFHWKDVTSSFYEWAKNTKLKDIS